MNDRSLPWIEYAKRDIKAAENLLVDDFVANAVLLHCHQAVEKIFKAILAEYDIAIPRIHELNKLHNLVPIDIRNELKINLSELITIDEIYIDSRYPADAGILPSGFPSGEEAGEIFTIAKKIYSACYSSLINDPDDDNPKCNEKNHI